MISDEDLAPVPELRRVARGETVVLRPSTRSALARLGASVLLLLMFVALLILDADLLSVAGTVGFGLIVIVSARMAMPGGAYLQVSPQGLTIKTAFRVRTYAWDDVENFRVYALGMFWSQEFVGFDLCGLTPERRNFWQTMGRGMSGIDVTLGENFGVRPFQLARELDDLRHRYATPAGPSPSERAELELERRAAAIDTSRRVVVTWMVALVCAGIYAWEVHRFGITPTGAELVDLGGAIRGADWRALLAGNLLHADPFHLVLNLVAWGLAGSLLEREIGAPSMAVLVAAGSVASMGLAVVIQPDVVTVGLSGVVYAALGWAVVRDVHRTRALGSTAWAMLPIGVIYTFVGEATSIGGHLGGLVAGLALGWYTSRS